MASSITSPLLTELSGIAFDALQEAFRKEDIDKMVELSPPLPELSERIYIFIDPAAGGPQSDYAILSVTRARGILKVNYCLIVPALSTQCMPVESPLTDRCKCKTGSESTQAQFWRVIF